MEKLQKRCQFYSDNFRFFSNQLYIPVRFKNNQLNDIFIWCSLISIKQQSLANCHDYSIIYFWFCNQIVHIFFTTRPWQLRKTRFSEAIIYLWNSSVNDTKTNTIWFRRNVLEDDFDLIGLAVGNVICLLKKMLRRRGTRLRLILSFGTSF
jgi:hypothetical protein